MLLPVLIVAFIVLLGGFLALLSTPPEKAPQEPPRRVVTPGKGSALYKPLEGDSDPQEGLPRGTWVL